MSRIFLLSLALPMLLVSCAGYHLGGNKPTKLAHVKKIQVPLFTNKTQLTRVDAYATNSAVDAITRDGTYQIGTQDNADAILRGTVKSADYTQVSSSRIDTLRTVELGMKITIDWEVVDAQSGQILAKGESTGNTRFFTGDNMQVARTNAIPDALRRACESMVSHLSDGF